MPRQPEQILMPAPTDRTIEKLGALQFLKLSKTMTVEATSNVAPRRPRETAQNGSQRSPTIAYRGPQNSRRRPDMATSPASKGARRRQRAPRRLKTPPRDSREPPKQLDCTYSGRAPREARGIHVRK